MVFLSIFDFILRRSWLIGLSMVLGAGVAYAADGHLPVLLDDSRTNTLATVGAGTVIGLIAGVIAGIGLDLRGLKMRTPSEVKRRLRIEALAVETFEARAGSALPSEEFPEALQAYEELADSIRASRVRTLLVTSASAAEGKSTTAANLASALAAQGHKVVLVDADMRWSALRNTGNKESSLGFAGLLLNYVHTPLLAVTRTREPNLFLLPAGTRPPHPASLLATHRLEEIIGSLSEMAAYVIFDSPSVLEAEDACILAQYVDATLLVTHAQHARSRRAARAVRMLSKVDARPMGIVLNATKPRRKRAQVKDAALVAAPAHDVSLDEPVIEDVPVVAHAASAIGGESRLEVVASETQVPPVSTPSTAEEVAGELEGQRTYYSFEDELARRANERQKRLADPDFMQRLSALRNLRVVDEGVGEHAADSEDALAATAARAQITSVRPPLRAVDEPVSQAPLQTGPFDELSPDVTEEVLVHMTETLRMIREMRERPASGRPLR